MLPSGDTFLKGGSQARFSPFHRQPVFEINDTETFSSSITVTKQPDNVITIAFGQSRTSDFAPMKALIIDDNASSRMTLSSVLRDIGITRIKMAPTTHQAKPVYGVVSQ